MATLFCHSRLKVGRFSPVESSLDHLDSHDFTLSQLGYFPFFAWSSLRDPKISWFMKASPHNMGAIINNHQDPSTLNSPPFFHSTLMAGAWINKGSIPSWYGALDSSKSQTGSYWVAPEACKGWSFKKRLFSGGNWGRLGAPETVVKFVKVKWFWGGVFDWLGWLFWFFWWFWLFWATWLFCLY